MTVPYCNAVSCLTYVGMFKPKVGRITIFLAYNCNLRMWLASCVAGFLHSQYCLVSAASNGK